MKQYAMCKYVELQVAKVSSFIWELWLKMAVQIQTDAKRMWWKGTKGSL